MRFNVDRFLSIITTAFMAWMIQPRRAGVLPLPQRMIARCSEFALQSLSELPAILTTTPLADDFKIQRALNLDGGSSSAFWFARANGSAFSIREQKPVRDFVGVVPKL